MKTSAESGYPEFDAGGWYGIVAPTGTPEIIVNLLNTKINLILDMPDVQESLIAAGFDVIKGTPKDFAEIIRRDYARWGEVVQLNGKTK